MTTKKQTITAVIMAGGKGERFWPKSRENMPKQFISLTEDGQSMIQHTVTRLKDLVEIDDTYIVTNQNYKPLVADHIPQMPKENILVEPMGKNTAPCIGLAAVHIAKKNPDAIMVVLPSDHLIKYNEMFLDTLQQAADVAVQGDNLITIGITPSYPETGYGYINFTRKQQEKNYANAYKVKRFVEKPNLDTAKEYLSSGQYLWNSGMFVWKASTILESIKTYMPELYAGLMRISDAIGTKDEEMVVYEEFKNFKSESIDYGIMEKSDNIYTIPGTFGWDDVGNWLALERIQTSNQDGNIVSGNVITIDTKNCIIQAGDKLIATIGMKNIVIVDTGDAMLICKKDKTQDVKEVLSNLKICNRNEYL